MEEAWELAVVSEDNSVRVALASGGGEFEAKGQWVERLGNSLVDFVSPATELSGLVGTSIRAVRYEVAVRAAIRAKQISEEKGLRLNPVSMKFLVPWAEASSLEPEEDNLTEQWAKLLSSESDREDFNSILYVDVLKKLRPQHVKYLTELTQGKTADELAEPQGILHENTICYNILKSIGYNDFDNTALTPGNDYCSDLLREKLIDIPGSVVSWATVFPADQDNSVVGVSMVADYARPSIALADSTVSAPLEAIGLIRSGVHNQIDERGEFEVRFHSIMLTSFGFGFVRRCIV
ncbi:MAG: Abi-alpha family protein [Litorimonas sp.]